MTLQTIIGFESIAAGWSSCSSLLQPEWKKYKFKKQQQLKKTNKQTNKQASKQANKQTNRCISRQVFQVLYILPYEKGNIFGLYINLIRIVFNHLHNKSNCFQTRAIQNYAKHFKPYIFRNTVQFFWTILWIWAKTMKLLWCISVDW